MKYRILNMADAEIADDLFDPLRDIAEVISLSPNEEALRAQLPRSDGYINSLKIRVTRELLSLAPDLRVIVSPSTGSDHLDLVAMKEKGIDYLSLKGEEEFLRSVTATSEMTWALLLATVRRLPWSFAAAQGGNWARDQFRGHQLSGKTLGIVGYGRLGRITADYGKAFRMRVLATDPKKMTPDEGVTMVPFDQLLYESDVISIHVHLDDCTRHMFDRAAFDAMKPNAIILNTSRGAVIDEEALLEALTNRKIGGAGLDVIHGEWRSDLENHPLIAYSRSHENVVISPHTGGVTYESQRAGMNKVISKLRNYLLQRKN